jgi:hypothetical protein
VATHLIEFGRRERVNPLLMRASGKRKWSEFDTSPLEEEWWQATSLSLVGVRAGQSLGLTSPLRSVPPQGRGAPSFGISTN